MSLRDSSLTHIDHEIAQLLALHRQIADVLAYCQYPPVVKQAIVTAYAAHWRTLAEFFHDGRPAKQEQRKTGGRRDATYFRVTGHKRPDWGPGERERLEDADKLVAHLSLGRVDREGATIHWGRREDLELLRPHLEALFAELPDTALPEARNEWREVNGGGAA